MPQLGAPEVLVIFIVALLVFGPQRLPEIGRQVARGIRELRAFQQHLRDEIDDAFTVKDPDDDADLGPPAYPARDGPPPDAPDDQPSPGTTT